MQSKSKDAVTKVPAQNSKRRTKKKHDEFPVDVAFRKIKEMMYHHEIVPGQKLLYEELANKFNMSITPIIQALNRLQVLNIVYYERNKGYYVGEVSPVEMKELFDAREALETFLVPAIIKNLTDERLQGLKRILKEHVEAASVPEYRRMILLGEARFHLAVVKIADNKVVSNICSMIFEQIYLKYRPEFMREERIKSAAEEHLALLNALEERNVSKTTRLLKQHIKNGRDHLTGGLWQVKEINLKI